MSAFQRVFCWRRCSSSPLAVAGALYHRVSHRRDRADSPVFEVATTGDLRDLFRSARSAGSTIADLALRKLENVYYKPVDPQTPIAGERDALRELLEREEDRQRRRCRRRRRAATRPKTARAPPTLLAYAQQHYGADARSERARRSHRRGAARHHELGQRSVHRLSFAARDSRTQRIALRRKLRRHRRLHLSAQRRPHHRAADRGRCRPRAPA